MNLATIALHVAADPPANRPRTLSHAGYVREILAHAGLFFDEVSRQQLPLPPSPFRGGAGGGVLLLAGDAALTEGEYEVRVKVKGFSESDMKAEAKFVVQPSDQGELTALNCNEDLLRQMASQSRGEMLMRPSV